MKQWWTLPELAARALPGLPGTKQGLAKYAVNAGWAKATRPDGSPAARKRQGRGGGTEFHVSLLPVSVKAALGSEHAASAHGGDIVIPELPARTAAGAVVRDARIAILEAANRHREATGLPQNEADEAFATAYNAGQVAVDLAVKCTIKSISRRSLYRWRDAVRSGDAAAIAARQGRRAGASTLDIANDGQVAAIIGAMLVNNPLFTAEHVRRYIDAKFSAGLDVDGELVPVPSIAAFRRHIAEFRAEHKVALTKLTDPDAFKSRYRIAGLSRHAHVERLNQTWQIDASPADALCLDGRWSIYVCVDVWSRRALGYVSRTPRAAAVQLLVRKAILAWGVPETIESDNGSDFAARTTQALLAALGVKHHRCDPYSPEQKGIVERTIGTMQHDLSRMLPGFIGHSVADRKSIEARRSFAARLGLDDAKAFAVELTGAELQLYLDRWCEHHYGTRSHSGLQGATPFAKAATFAGRLRRVESDRALDVLLMDVADGGGVRTVGKQGIRVGGQIFLAPTIRVGDKVLVRLDPQDLGRAYCFSPDGTQFLGEAMCPEAIGVDRAAAVAEARAQQKRMIDEQTAAIRAEAKKIKPRDVIDTVLRASGEKAGKIVSFPKPSDTHSTPALEAAAEAAPRGGAPRQAKLTDEQREKHKAMVAAFESGEPAKVVALKPAGKPDAVTDKKERYRQWLALNARDQAGEPLSDDERRHLSVYPTTSEYRAVAAMVADFGPEWLGVSVPQRAAN